MGPPESRRRACPQCGGSAGPPARRGVRRRLGAPPHRGRPQGEVARFPRPQPRGDGVAHGQARGRGSPPPPLPAGGCRASEGPRRKGPEPGRRWGWGAAGGRARLESAGGGQGDATITTDSLNKHINSRHLLLAAPDNLSTRVQQVGRCLPLPGGPAPAERARPALRPIPAPGPAWGALARPPRAAHWYGALPQGHPHVLVRPRASRSLRGAGCPRHPRRHLPLQPRSGEPRGLESPGRRSGGPEFGIVVHLQTRVRNSRSLPSLPTQCVLVRATPAPGTYPPARPRGANRLRRGTKRLQGGARREIRAASRTHRLCVPRGEGPRERCLRGAAVGTAWP